MATQQSPKILDFQVTTVYNGELAPWALKGTLLTGGDVTTHTHEMTDIISLIPTLNGKASITHTHTRSQITDFAHTHPIADIDGLQDALDADDCGACLDRILTDGDRVLVGNANVLYRAA